MPALEVFPDVEDAVTVLLSSLAPADTFVGDDLKDVMPMFYVYRFAGDDNYITDFPVLGIDTFAPTRAIGRLLAEQARQLMLAAPHSVTTDSGIVVIDRVRTGEAPHEVPYGDSAIRRWVSSYTLELRR